MCSAVLSRRRLLIGSTSLAAACGVGGLASYWPEQATDHREVPLAGPSLPQFRADARAAPALAERFPWVQYGETTTHELQIANAFQPALALDSTPTKGLLGEREFRVESGRAVIPWAPMFERPSAVVRGNRDLQTLVGVEQLFIKDEGSDQIAIYGNKVRKYEFLLPNLHYSGVRKVYSHGAYGSNHCAHLALAARFSEFHAAPGSDGMKVVLNLYPQTITENVITKLRLLAATGVTLNFLPGDAAVGLSIKLLSQMNQTTERSTEGYIDPGGSSPLSVLGHVEAAMELAKQIESRSCALDRYPDYVFLPIGTGGTAMGLALGFYLLGWPTRIVVTCSQDKGFLARLVVNGDIGVPFDIAHARNLLAESMPWARRLGLVDGDTTPADILKGRFFYDNDTWRPGYGQMSETVAERARLAGDGGLVLDGTFSAKAFNTLASYARGGLLNGKRVVFWNTYQRFPFETLIPEDDAWARYLPEDIQSRLVS
ncbi:MAG: pyridoxal-phosphate dependent enzyme [Methylocella sp.]